MGYVYDAEVVRADGTALVDLDAPGWDAHVRGATRFTLVPKQPGTMPVVSVQIPDGCEPVFRTRVFAAIGGGAIGDFRCYAIGYRTPDDRERLTWVLPNGVIDIGDDPHLAVPLLRERTL